MGEARFDVAVVGSGVMGAATARALARRSLDVVIFEQFRVGHSRGSSHGASRIFRLSYPEARYVRMAQESLELWRSLESETGTTLLTTTGGLDSGKALDDHVRALSSCGATCETLDGSDVARRWPALRLPAGERVLHQPDAGIVAADRAVQTFKTAALGAGATLLEDARVTVVEQDADGVSIRAGATTTSASAVVVTAGAWARDLLAGAGIDLAVRPTRETVSYFEHPEPFPPTLVEWGDPSIYALASPGQGIKAGEHVAGPTTDPDDDGDVNLASVERVTRWVAERFPNAAVRPHHSETCLYTNTEDEHFVLERRGRIVVGSPCSGHGFKFAPWVGEHLAGLAQEVL